MAASIMVGGKHKNPWFLFSQKLSLDATQRYLPILFFHQVKLSSQPSENKIVRKWDACTDKVGKYTELFPYFLSCFFFQAVLNNIFTHATAGNIMVEGTHDHWQVTDRPGHIGLDKKRAWAGVKFTRTAFDSYWITALLWAQMYI